MTNSQGLAVLLLLVLLDHIDMIRAAIGPLLGVSSSPELLLIAWAWLILMGATFAALLRRPRWSLYLMLLLIPLSTIFLGISFVPFVMMIVPAALSPYALMLANIAVLVGSVILLRRQTAAETAPAAGLP